MENLAQWRQEVLSGSKRIAIPIMTNPGIELCHYKITDAVKNGKIHAEAILKLNEVYPPDASTVIMDLTVEAEAFGAEIVFPEDEVPSVTGILINDLEQAEAIEIPPLTAGRVQEYLLANRITAENITDKPVLAGCIGPFSLAGRLMGMTEIMMALYTEPETVEVLLEKCTLFLENYIGAIKETGVDGVIMAEPAAGLISNDDCSTYSSKYIQKIVEKLQDDSFMIVLHNCGNGGHCTAAMLETKASALHFGNKIDMLQALNDCPEDILVMGNLDPVNVLKMSTSEKVEEETNHLLKATAHYKNFILSTGCDVPPMIPMENIAAFYRALKEYNRINS